MPRRRLHRIPAAVVAAALATAATARAGDNPGYDRPGLGFTPSVLQPGDVTFEQGLPDWSRGAEGDYTDFDSLLRVGVGHALEVQLGSGFGRRNAPARAARGREDSIVGVKFAPAAQGAFSWGVLGNVELTDGNGALRADRRTWTVGASGNWQVDATHSRGLYVEAAHGDVASQLVAANLGWMPSAALGAYVEFGLQHASGDGNGSVVGTGVAWQVTPRLQLDASVRHRLTGHADTWQAGLGAAWFFAR